MKRSIIYLAILTILALLALWMFAPGAGPAGNSAANSLLLPGIAKQINDVNRVEIVSAGNTTVATLVKTDHSWQLEQMAGYRADWPKLQKLLAALAQARVIENKTDKPEYYSRLGVEDIAAGNAGGVLVKLGIDDQFTGVLIGHEAQGRTGQFVRLQNATASALVDRRLEVPTGPMAWVDTTIVDINASEVAEVEIIHPGGERILVTRVSADQTDFELAGLPPGREIKSSWAVNSLGSVFSMLNMETVRPADSIDWSGAVKMRLLMFSGLEILSDALENEGEYLLRLHASHPASEVVKATEEIEQSSVEQQAIEARANHDVANNVDLINQKVAGWVYGIAKQKYDAMVKTQDDLLKPLESL
jgi:hypothetical protein